MPGNKVTWRRWWGALALLLGCLPAGYAQVGLHVDTDRVTYVQYEGVNARVTVRNVSGNALDFRPLGSDSIPPGPRDPLAAPRPAQGEILFEVRGPRGKLLEPHRDGFNPAADLNLTAGGTRVLEVPLSLLYDLTTEGEYEVMVRARHLRFRSDYGSNRTKFTVRSARPVKDIDGRLMAIEVGVPALSTHAPIQTRMVSLFSFHPSMGDQIGLRIADDQFVYAVQRLGPHLRAARTMLEVDSRSQIHVMIDIHPKLTGYWVYDLDGKLKRMIHYRFDRENIGRLLRDPDLGRVMVVGAEPAIEGVDFNLADVPVMTVGGSGGDLQEEWNRRNRPPSTKPAPGTGPADLPKPQ